MLSRDEERSLAELEARLGDEDPQLAALLAGAHPSTFPETGRSARVDPGTPTAPSLLGEVIRTALVLAAAVALTGLTTVWFGPDVGGLVGAVGLPLAGLYGWRHLGACRGARATR